MPIGESTAPRCLLGVGWRLRLLATPHHVAGHRDWLPKSEEYEVTNSKLQAALDEIERLCETVKGFKGRNGGTLPNPDSDAGRALSLLETFAVNSKNWILAKYSVTRYRQQSEFTFVRSVIYTSLTEWYDLGADDLEGRRR